MVKLYGLTSPMRIGRPAVPAPAGRPVDVAVAVVAIEARSLRVGESLEFGHAETAVQLGRLHRTRQQVTLADVTTQTP